MPEEPPIARSLRTLIAVARSQKEVARLANVSDGTLINWMRGLGLRESKLRTVARNLGVSLRWLRDNVGDDDAEVASFRSRLGPVATGARGKLAEALASRRLTPQQLAKLIRYDAGVIEHVINGTGKASEKMIEAICRELPELSKEDLMAGSDHPAVIAEDGMSGIYGAKPNVALLPGMKGRMVPMLSMAQAGGWDSGHSDEGWSGESVFAMNVDDRRAFAIRVAGNSMEPDIREGDVVICSPREELTQGCCAVVRTRSEQAFIKFWRERGGTVTLESANPDYKPIQFPLTEIAGAWPVVQRIATGKIKKQL